MVQLSQAYVEWEGEQKNGVNERSLLLRLLNRRFGELPIALQSKIDRRSVPELENLALLN